MFASYGYPSGNTRKIQNTWLLKPPNPPGGFRHHSECYSASISGRMLATYHMQLPSHKQIDYTKLLHIDQPVVGELEAGNHFEGHEAHGPEGIVQRRAELTCSSE